MDFYLLKNIKTKILCLDNFVTKDDLYWCYVKSKYTKIGYKVKPLSWNQRDRSQKTIILVWIKKEEIFDIFFWKKKVMRSKN